MNNDPFQTISKSGIERVKELYFSLRIIFDCKSLIQNGKFYHISVIYGQLRSLLTERSKGISPLLFHIASIQNKKMELYHLPDTFEKNLPPNLLEGLSIHYNSTNPSIERIFPNQEKISLEKFLNTDVITYETRKFTVRKIIDELANKYGGAHYSQKTNKYLSELLSFSFNNQTMLDTLIIEIAELTSKFGLTLLKSVTDIDFYMHIYLTEKKIKDEVFLIDYKLPNNPNRFSLILNQGKLHFRIVDTLGFAYILSTKGLVEYEKIQLLNISIETTSLFRTSIKIYIQENLVGELNLDDPILTFNQIHSYDCYMNKQVNGENQEYEFGLSEFQIYSKLPNYVEKNHIYKHYTSMKYDEIFWIGEKEFGYSKSENRNFEMSNGFKKKKIKTL